MLVIVGIMLAGVLLGYLLRSFSLKYLNALIMGAILMLLFLLGVGVGGNKQIMNNLWNIGGTGALIAIAGLLGSVSMAKVIDIWIKPTPNHEVSAKEKLGDGK